jgi:hypothetical protein
MRERQRLGDSNDERDKHAPGEATMSEMGTRQSRAGPESARGRTSGGEPDTALTAVIGVATAIVLVAMVIFLQAYFYRQERGERVRKVEAVAPEQLAQQRAEQQELLSSYRLIDGKTGVVGIPIERAMELLVREAGAEGASARLSSGPPRVAPATTSGPNHGMSKHE